MEIDASMEMIVRLWILFVKLFRFHFKCGWRILNVNLIEVLPFVIICIVTHNLTNRTTAVIHRFAAAGLNWSMTVYGTFLR